jgi:ABC-type nitrate/sulfonate/bicarbonate transport system substrate-binding protein
MPMKRRILMVLLLLMALPAAACGGPDKKELTPVTFMLDWVPNTNHTGVFVAKAKGYFEEAGLDVKIIQPGEVYPEAAVAGGAADFGISFQESLTLARAEKIPLVSIAALLQHNTSGFASLASLKVTGPKAFEGLTYGAFGSPFEEPTLKMLMESQGGDFNKLKIQNIGFTDPIPLLAERKIDLAWIFYGWAGIDAKQRGLELNVVMMKDYFNVIPDYYTPLIIAHESTIAKKPDVVRAFMKALSRGYDFTIQNPEAAADILLAAAPELDARLVKASQLWLKDYYKATAPRWGEQQKSVWQGYIDWMVKNKILATPISATDAFTNAFLP